MRQIRSRLRAAVALSLAFVAHAGATATYDYKPGEFLVIAHWAPDSKGVGITSRADRHWANNAIYRIENRHAYPVKTPELLCHAVPEFCQLTKELGGALTEDQIYAEDTVGKPWKAHQNSSYSEIVKWISPTRFVISEEDQFQVKDRDPTAALDKCGEVEKLDPETYGGVDVYDASFNAEGECELLPADKTRVLSTQPVKEQKTNE